MGNTECQYCHAVGTYIKIGSGGMSKTIIRWIKPNNYALGYEELTQSVNVSTCVLCYLKKHPEDKYDYPVWYVMNDD